MPKRKLSVLLRRDPLSDRVYAITNYRIQKGGMTIVVLDGGKHDVTEDFNALARGDQ